MSFSPSQRKSPGGHTNSPTARSPSRSSMRIVAVAAGIAPGYASAGRHGLHEVAQLARRDPTRRRRLRALGRQGPGGPSGLQNRQADVAHRLVGSTPAPPRGVGSRSTKRPPRLWVGLSRLGQAFQTAEWLLQNSVPPESTRQGGPPSRGAFSSLLCPPAPRPRPTPEPGAASRRVLSGHGCAARGRRGGSAGVLRAPARSGGNGDGGVSFARP